MDYFVAKPRTKTSESKNLGGVFGHDGQVVQGGKAKRS
jgi:hypothetical protein